MTAEDWDAERYRKQRRKWWCSLTLGAIFVAVTAPVAAAIRINHSRSTIDTQPDGNLLVAILAVDR